jgi:hypothetical protein
LYSIFPKLLKVTGSQKPEKKEEKETKKIFKKKKKNKIKIQ